MFEELCECPLKADLAHDFLHLTADSIYLTQTDVVNLLRRQIRRGEMPTPRSVELFAIRDLPDPDFFETRRQINVLEETQHPFVRRHDSVFDEDLRVCLQFFLLLCRNGIRHVAVRLVEQTPCRIIDNLLSNLSRQPRHDNACVNDFSIGSLLHESERLIHVFRKAVEPSIPRFEVFDRLELQRRGQRTCILNPSALSQRDQMPAKFESFDGILILTAKQLVTNAIQLRQKW